ncbi:hypothetical protein RC52_07200 [Herbaspirillum rubrisubalbicans]|uniref:Uncharacterized protein n=1 Tax=Herbaspirillum rubrisubalbicans TaxID=80842 RepID=A0AAD0XIT7_9BURK|nr:hypothetical protein RC54_08390 [Herbaspirillum rubrisubalbicans]NQE48259.1 hypothetical protein [Herbaspirillum rubrisubalbicans]
MTMAAVLIVAMTDQPALRANSAVQDRPGGTRLQTSATMKLMSVAPPAAVMLAGLPGSPGAGTTVDLG